jgi:hypothetical protein
MPIKEMDFWSIIEGKATIPTNPQQLAKYENKFVKVKRFILDYMKD